MPLQRGELDNLACSVQYGFPDESLLKRSLKRMRVCLDSENEVFNFEDENEDGEDDSDEPSTICAPISTAAGDVQVGQTPSCASPTGSEAMAERSRYRFDVGQAIQYQVRKLQSMSWQEKSLRVEKSLQNLNFVWDFEILCGIFLHHTWSVWGCGG